MLAATSNSEPTDEEAQAKGQEHLQQQSPDEANGSIQCYIAGGPEEGAAPPIRLFNIVKGQTGWCSVILDFLYGIECDPSC